MRETQGRRTALRIALLRKMKKGRPKGRPSRYTTPGGDFEGIRDFAKRLDTVNQRITGPL
jgi:hypothetical protein